ncbi:MAG: lipid A deacylase LpxR family protein, partial [Bacteroidota bacterium]
MKSSPVAAMRMPQYLSLVLAALFFSTPALAQQVGVRSFLPSEPLTSRAFYWENDFPYTDQFYTNGLQFAWNTYRDGAQPLQSRTPFWLWALDRLPVVDLDALFPPCREAKDNCWQGLQGGRFGQVFYTPRRIITPTLQSNDRPYAGWLYYASSAEWRTTTQTPQQWKAELVLGFIGPISFAEEVQRNWHDQIGARDPLGWDTQLERALPSFAFRLEHRRRLYRHRFFPGWLVADVNGLGAVTLGNVHNRAEVGGELRFGMPLNQGTIAQDFPLLPVEPTFVSGARMIDGELGALNLSDIQAVADSLSLVLLADSLT